MVRWQPLISKDEGSRGRKSPPQSNVCRSDSYEPRTERRHRKKTLKPAIKCELVSYLTAQFAVSLRQTCRTLSMSRTVYFYQPNTQVLHALTEMAEHYPRYCFKILFQMLRRQGNARNHKRVNRIYCLLILNFRRREKQCLPVHNPVPLAISEELICGRRFRIFNVMDDFNH